MTDFGLLSELESSFQTRMGPFRELEQSYRRQQDRFSDSVLGPVAELENSFRGSGRRYGVDAETQLDFLRGNLPDDDDGFFLRRAVSNVPHNAKELLQGLTQIGGLLKTAAVDVARVPFNFLTGDFDDLEEIRQRYVNAAGMVDDIFKGEWDRLREVYGSVLEGDVEPLKEFIAERPLDFLFDAAAVTGVGAAATGAKSAAVGGRAARALQSANKALGLDRKLEVLPGDDLAIERLVTAERSPSALSVLREGGTAEEAASAQARISTLSQNSVNIEEWRQNISRLTELYQVPADLIENATVWDGRKAIFQGANPFRLAFNTIGAIPPVNRLRELVANRIIATGDLADIHRMTDSLRDLFGKRTELALEPWRKLKDKETVFIYSQSLRSPDLTPEEQIAFRGLQRYDDDAFGLAFNVLKRQGKTPEEARALLNKSKMANAITQEARLRVQDPDWQRLPSHLRKEHEKLQNRRTADRLLESRDEVFAAKAAIEKDIDGFDLDNPTLFHVTRAKTKVKESGKLKNRQELEAEGLEIRGLGGASFTSISTTDSLSKARQIKGDMVQMTRAAKGEVSVDQMLDYLDRKFFGKNPSMDLYRGLMPAGVAVKNLDEARRAVKLAYKDNPNDVIKLFLDYEDRADLYSPKDLSLVKSLFVRGGATDHKGMAQQLAKEFKDQDLKEIGVVNVRASKAAVPTNILSKEREISFQSSDLMLQRTLRAKERDLDVARTKTSYIYQAEEKLARRELIFFPGQRGFVDVPEIDFQDLSFSAPLASPDVARSSPTTGHLSQKKDIVTNPISVEDNVLAYVDNMGKLSGKLKLAEQAIARGTELDRAGFERMLLEAAVIPAKGVRKSPGLDIIKIQGKPYLLPKGMADIYAGALNRTKDVPLAGFLDFTKKEFAKVVLHYNPGWLMYNVLGGATLYTLAGGSPRALARALKYKTASSVDDAVKAARLAGENVPKPLAFVHKLMENAAKEYRQVMPQSEVFGFGAEFSHSVRYPERISPDMVDWENYAGKKWRLALSRIKSEKLNLSGAEVASLYGAATKGIAEIPKTVAKKLGMDEKLANRFVPTIGELNEAVEEIYRTATWLSVGQRKLAAKNFSETGHLAWSLNSPEMKAGFQKMTNELDARRVLESGPLRLSDDTKAVRDLTNRFMNDYYRLSPMERKLHRRIFPFWSWMKFINRLSVELPVYHPVRTAVAMHTSNAVNDALAVDENLPEWLQEMVPVKKNADGTTQFTSGKGVNIFAGVLWGNEGLEQTMRGVNPILMVPITFALGINSFRGGPYRVAPSRAGGIQGLLGTSAPVSRSFGSEDAFTLTPNGLEETRPRPSIFLALARGGLLPLPGFRQAERALRGGSHDDIGTIAELGFELGNVLLGQPRTYPGAFIDKATKKPLGEKPTSENILSGFGLGSTNIDTEAVQSLESQKRLKAINDILKRERGL